MRRASEGRKGEVKETLARDGRYALYSVDRRAERPSDTDEWIASDTTISKSDMQ